MSRTGTEMNGFVNFLKPAGMSSHDAVDFFRRLSGVRRVGHTGTLDPMAVGVLPLCVGKATRIAEYLASDRKRYRCEMQLGITTDTQDVWGRVISKAEDGFAARLCEPLLKETAARFTGPQLQTPPAYSAVKIAGKKLYEYARSGEAVAAPARRTEIFSLEIKRSDLARGLVNFEAECSKGTYMRTLCHDMGQMLGCGAAMSGLIRLDSGMFAIDDAYTVEALEAAFSPDSAPEGVLTAMDAPLREFPSVELSASASRAFVNGARVGLSPREAAGAGGAGSRALCRVYGEAGAGGIGGTAVFLGMGRLEADALVADKVFCQL
ncbi:MAG: tRNA pseudouridine(55) synthase TruB [Clostridiales Family XIII bacterium]|jgi:tRNA pseudouridine55 synthase|nr:tRNA pseudouridine(55) synthase TruB [Clostridiales Family XIII bacterium]